MVLAHAALLFRPSSCQCSSSYTLLDHIAVYYGVTLACLRDEQRVDNATLASPRASRHVLTTESINLFLKDKLLKDGKVNFTWLGTRCVFIDAILQGFDSEFRCMPARKS